MAIDNEKISLTKEDADFVEDLINKYRYIIISAVNTYLDQSVSYLVVDCISGIYLISCRNVSYWKTHPQPGGMNRQTSKKFPKSLYIMFGLKKRFPKRFYRLLRSAKRKYTKFCISAVSRQMPPRKNSVCPIVR